jgi:hypothetical protein
LSIDGRFRDSQPESMTAFGAGASRVDPKETFEDLCPMSVVNPWLHMPAHREQAFHVNVNADSGGT